MLRRVQKKVEIRAFGTASEGMNPGHSARSRYAEYDKGTEFMLVSSFDGDI